MDQRTRKLMIIDKDLHSGDDIDCMCQEKKKEEDSSGVKIA